jgi:hypothetical protein
VQGIIREGRLDAGSIFSNIRLIFGRHKMNTASASASVTTCPPCVQDHFMLSPRRLFSFRLEVEGPYISPKFASGLDAMADMALALK